MYYLASVRHLRILIASLAVMVLLAGCARSGQVKAPESEIDNTLSTAQLTGDFSRSKLIAADFVATIAQLPESKPSQTVLHTSQPETRFGKLLLSALQTAGFDLRFGDDQSQYWLDYNANRESALSDTGNPIYTFIVAAGSIKLKRSYEVDQYGVSPAGSMFVRGATTDNVVMDNSIFSVRSAPTIEALNEDQDPYQPLNTTNQGDVEVSAVPAPKPFIRTRKQQNIATVNASVPSSANDEQSSLAAVGGDYVSTNGDYSEFTNVFDTKESRYKEIFKSYDLVDSNVYIFPNDSLVLGKQNKIQIKKLALNFNADTDVVSVIGCSHGHTNLKNGNAYLANNRAFRVKEEFVLVGLDADKVLEEGCWANVGYDEMPDRGVLVEHKRLKQ